MKFLNWLFAFFKLQVIPIGYLVVPYKSKHTNVIIELMKHFDTLQADGEWKAHQVYATLLKRFPESPKADLRLEMEVVYQQFFKDA